MKAIVAVALMAVGVGLGLVTLAANNTQGTECTCQAQVGPPWSGQNRPPSASRKGKGWDRGGRGRGVPDEGNRTGCGGRIRRKPVDLWTYCGYNGTT